MTNTFTNVFKDLTPASAALYIRLVQEAEYEDYDGGDSFQLALSKFTSSQRGNLTDLKRKGLVETFADPDLHDNYLWVKFTNVEVARHVEAILKG